MFLYIKLAFRDSLGPKLARGRIILSAQLGLVSATFADIFFRQFFFFFFGQCLSSIPAAMNGMRRGGYPIAIVSPPAGTSNVASQQSHLGLKFPKPTNK